MTYNNVLFITDSYEPTASSNGICVARLWREVKNPDKAYLLASTKVEDDKKNFENLRVCYYQRQRSSLFCRLFSFAEDNKMVNKYYNEACKIIDNSNINIVVTVYRPIELLIVGLKLKEKYGENIKLISYFLDNLTEKISVGSFKYRYFALQHKRLLKSIKNKSDKIVCLKYYKNEVEKDLEKCNTKIDYVGLPNLIKPKYSTYKNEEDSKIRIIYAGSFYKNIRNPKTVLDFFCKMCKNMPELELHFYSWGCEDEINKAKSLIGEQLFIHGRVSSEEIQKIIARADVLLNVANDIPHQVPGKLIEYFTTGLPVICYVFRDDDPANDEYRKYKNIFIVKKCFNDNNIKECIKFIKNSKPLDWNTIYESFCDSTPEYTLKKMFDHEVNKNV